ncbi:hypothetical protein Q2T40_20340 [Winogradskyella maritima]|uniref:Glycosyl hydrolase family 16 n=1 Tax=Winogradskyella maritima TaxID=1517766 RepID=A0ABV8ACQ6_9FLAO|nr:hypothetical protein [Winogradskyella maritima]
MKKYSKVSVPVMILGLMSVLFFGCEREVSDDVEFATFFKNGEVFIDGFSAGLDYFPFVDAGADPEAFSVVTDDVFEGSSAMRFDVPSFGNGFVGATFNTTVARDLSGFDALTFYAKASQAATIDAIGFGISGETGNKFQVTKNGLEVSTNWKKYILPIPDPSKLINETGLFWLAEGASAPGGEGGYVLWFDNIQFERLGTVAQPQPKIFNGEDLSEQSFTGSTINVTGLTQTFNTASGENVTVNVAPSYYQFMSSDVDVARVSERGEISIVGVGQAEITALLGGVSAQGSLTLDVTGNFQGAETPPSRDPDDVISIFSDAYTNVNALNFAVFNDQNVQISTQTFGGDQIANYDNLSFVGLGWDGTVDVSNMTHLHIDVQLKDPASASLIVELIDFGADNSDGGGDDTGGGSVVTSNLSLGDWVGIDIPLDAFTQATGGGFAGSPNQNNIARVVLVSNGGSFAVDNIYFYRN